MISLLQAALKYAALGWPVLPCNPKTKAPLVEHGLKAATTDADQITAWWQKFPRAMIAVATGRVSGLVVCDIDLDEAKGIDGEAALATLLNGAGVPETLTARTPRGGRHLYFAHPHDRQIRNSASRLGPGLDTRADGGFIIVPPSRRADGKAYSWEPSWRPIQPAPKWMLPAPEPSRPKPNGHDTGAHMDDVRRRAYGEKALRGECDRLACAPEGRRNHELFRAGARLFELVAGQILTEAEVRSALWSAARACGLDDEEIAKTVESAHAHGSQEPRGPRPNSDSNRRYGPLAEAKHASHLPDDRNKVRTKPSVRLMTVQEYRAHEGHSAADFLVRGLMRLGTLIAIGGRPGSGKTGFGLALAQALDQGEPFLEREVKQAAVAYIAVEDAGDVANRIEALAADGVLLVQSEDGIPLAKPAQAKAIVAEVIRQARERKPGLPVVVVIDTLRAALGGTSVLEDKIVSPALNALRELAEVENAVIIILNHTNRADPKALKGETLEAVAALEIILLPGEGGWHAIHVGKNRSGPGNRQIGRLRMTSVKVGGVEAAITEEIVVDEQPSDGPKERKPGANQNLILKILKREILASGVESRPYGSDGPLVKAVRESVLRDEFMKLKAGDNRDTKGKAFNRALDWLLERAEVVRNEDQAGRGIIWFGSRDDEVNAMRGHFRNVRDVRE